MSRIAWCVVWLWAGACVPDDIRRAVCDDLDEDGVCDDEDFCVGSNNSGDADADGICNDLDVCDRGDDADDLDGDGVADACDACPGTASGTAVGADGCVPDTGDTAETDDTGDSDDTGDTAETDGGETDDTDVATNQAPTVTTPSIGPSPAYNDSTLTCSASGSDPDGPTPTVSFAWDNTTTVASLGAGTQITLSSASASPGDSIRCTATASDGQLSASDTATVTLLDRAPTVSKPAIQGGMVYNDSTLSCTATASDPDGGDPSVTYAWTNETQGSASLGTSSQLALTPSMAVPGDELRCTATASHGGLSSSDFRDVTVVNRAPTPNAPVLGPTTAYNDSTLTCSGSGTDPDGTAVSTTYAWENVSRSGALGSGGAITLSSAVAAPGEVVRCTVTVSDGDASANASVSVTLSNRPPVLGTPEVFPPQPSVGGAVRCEATVDDPDGVVDAVTYRWTNITTSTELGTGASHTLDRVDVAPGDEVRCTATVSDGEASDVASSTVQTLQAGDLLETGPLGRAVLVPPGTFTMGCVAARDDVDQACDADESPARSVTRTRGVWMMEAELTQAQWVALGFPDPSTFGPQALANACGPDCPVESMTWWEAVHAANAASTAEGLPTCYALSGCSSNPVGEGRTCTGITVQAPGGDPQQCDGWRLPTEAEWEHAARADTSWLYAGSDDPDDVAWWGVTGGSTHPVCGLLRNEWGLCDLSGNVSEWVWDAYTSSYPAGNATDPWEPAPTAGGITRGGNWSFGAWHQRNAGRYYVTATNSGARTGFRLVRTAHRTADNHAPVVSQVVIMPHRQVTTGSTLTCTARGTDPDGTTPTVAYRWEDEGGASLGTGPTLDLSGIVSVGDAVSCVATADDGDANTEGEASVAIALEACGSTPVAPCGEDSSLGTVVYVPPGSFEMGCMPGRDEPCDASGSEEPLHEVTLTGAVWMMASEVTQADWTAVYPSAGNPSYFGPDADGYNVGPEGPIERVNWYEAAAFANSVSIRDGLSECYTLGSCSGTVGDGCDADSVVCSTGAYACDSVTPLVGCTGWRLPTEAEWEYAARGGEDTVFPGSDDVDAVAWSSSQSGSRTHRVCTLDPNGWGLCDMAGNAWEWTSDWYGAYGVASQTDPSGPSNGADKVRRSGSWGWGSTRARCAYREAEDPRRRGNASGIRLVRTAP